MVCRSISLLTVLVSVVGFTECGGYKQISDGGLPSHIRTIAVPAFENSALRASENSAPRFRVEQRFTEAVINEIIRRGGRLRVQSEVKGADAVIDGTIKRFEFSGVLLDDRGRARIFEVTIRAAVTVRDQTRNRVLYDNQEVVWRDEYEFARDPRTFFSEEDPAVQRMARDFAESLVSILINGYGVNAEP